MKKLYIYGIIALAAIVSCNKTEISETSATGEQQEGYGVIYATTEATKTTMAGSGIYERAEWVAGDEVVLFKHSANYSGYKYKAKTGGNATVAFEAMNEVIAPDSNRELVALYPADRDCYADAGWSTAQNSYPVIHPIIRSVQDGSFKNVILAGAPKSSQSNQFYFTAISSVIKMAVPADKNIIQIELESSNDIFGQFDAQYSSTGWATNNVKNAGKKIIVRNPQGKTLSGPVYISVLPCTSSSDITITLRSKDRFGRVTKTGVPAFKKNTIEDFGTANVTVTNYPKAFTIDAEGHQVFIAQGNLQYQASTKTWRFAEHQWDFVGNSSTGAVDGTVYEGNTKSKNTEVDSTYVGWIDLFGFGTSGYNGKMPYSTYSSDDGAYFPNVDLTLEENYDYDWGRYCDIKYKEDGEWKNDPYQHKWHTMTKDQWRYVIESRGINKKAIEIKASVQKETTTITCTIKGLAILPDYFEDPKPSNKSFDNTTTYTGEEFEYLVKEGVVFLPVCGMRAGTTVYRHNEYGFYHSTVRPDGESNGFGVSNSGYGFGYQIRSYQCCAVRLVRDVPTE